MPRKILHLPRDFKPPPRPEFEPDTPQHAAVRKLGFALSLLLIPLGAYAMLLSGKIQDFLLGFYAFGIVLFFVMQIRPGNGKFWEVFPGILYVLTLALWVRSPSRAVLGLALWLLILLWLIYCLTLKYINSSVFGRMMTGLGLCLATIYVVMVCWNKF